MKSTFSSAKSASSSERNTDFEIDQYQPTAKLLKQSLPNHQQHNATNYYGKSARNKLLTTGNENFVWPTRVHKQRDEHPTFSLAANPDSPAYSTATSVDVNVDDYLTRSSGAAAYYNPTHKLISDDTSIDVNVDGHLPQQEYSTHTQDYSDPNYEYDTRENKSPQYDYEYDTSEAPFPQYDYEYDTNEIKSPQFDYEYDTSEAQSPQYDYEYYSHETTTDIDEKVSFIHNL